MYKSRLHELCQEKSWKVPVFKTSKEGQDHCPRFSATVTVNDMTFQTHNSSNLTSSKLALNDVSRIAFLHFSSATPDLASGLPVVPNTTTYDNNIDITFPTDKSNPFNDPQINFAPEFIIHHTPLTAVGTNLDHVIPICEEHGFTDPHTNVTTTDSADDKNPTGMETVKVSHILANPPFSRGDKKSIDVQHVYKSQLQNYAWKKNIPVPIYSCQHEGPPHAIRFKSKVTFDGKTFESPGFFRTIKEAENEAARLAFVSVGEYQEDNSVSYKNILQVMVQREGFGLPTYRLNEFGESHRPTFVSTVEVNGEIFQGSEASTKKLAESNAAKVAYTAFTERKSYPHPKVPTSSSLSKVFDMETNVKDIVIMDHSDENRASEEVKVNVEVIPGQSHILSSKSAVTEKKGGPSGLPETVFAHRENPFPPAVGQSGLDCCEGVNAPRMKKLMVFPRTPNMVLPDGVSPHNVLPFSDDKWVAVRVTSP